MKNLFTRLIPMSLLKALRQSINFGRTPIYENYEKAFASCQNGAYQNIELVKVVIDKNLAYRERIQKDTVFDLGTLRTLIALGLSKTGNSLNVIDFGGGGGYHYTIASNAFGGSDSLKWNVVETTAMANEAQRMANSNLKFFDNLAEATADLGLVDLVFTSGALQYCPSPLAFLKQLTEVNAKYLFITRIALVETEESIYTSQVSHLSANGPGPLPAGYTDRRLRYPITYVSKSKLEAILEEKYHIRFKIVEDMEAYSICGKDIYMFGYFCIRKG